MGDERPAASVPEAADPIAVVGVGCRFPGAGDPWEFWRLLRAGGDATREVPAERWNVDAHYDPDLATSGTSNTRRGGFLDDVAGFDAAFFGISPGEARAMDPQQRLLLEVVWEALENANLAPRRLAGTEAGVFVGLGDNEYATVGFADLDDVNAYFAAGNAPCMAVNRVSQVLDLRGPSLVLDTGCSSSLVALHLACESLRRGESGTALCGGVNLILSPRVTIGLAQAWMSAADGRCKSFDAAADGYGRGEGCGVVVLKRLADAVRDGDPVRALIRGSAVNQDGRGDGLTVPNERALAAVMRRALAAAGVAADEVDYVEAHGVGSALTDVVEARALGAVYGGERRGGACRVGSVKTNIGHLEAAAGVAGLIKVVLGLEHGEIPPHLHLESLHPEIAAAGYSWVIPDGVSPWPAAERPRRAGLSAFGLGGTNAHVIVEEAPARRAATSSGPPYLLALSAKGTGALRDLAGRYARHLATVDEASIADVCSSAYLGREAFPQRLAVVAGSREALAAALTAAAQGEAGEGLLVGEAEAAPGEPPTAEAQGESRSRLLTALARRFVAGGELEWRQVEPEGASRQAALPTYPFERRRYWMGGAAARGREAPADAYPRWLRRLPSPLPVLQLAFRWEGGSPVLEDHRIYDHPVVSGPTIATAVLDAAEAAIGPAPYTLERMMFLRPLRLEPGRFREGQVLLTPAPDGAWEVELVSQGARASAPAWIRHATGRLRRGGPVAPGTVAVEEVRERCPGLLDGAGFYRSMARRRTDLGPSFQWLDRIWQGEGEGLARLRPPRAGEAVTTHLHPGCLDACFQLLFACLPPEELSRSAYMLVGFDRLSQAAEAGGAAAAGLWCRARRLAAAEAGEEAEAFAGDVEVTTAAGAVVAEIRGLYFRRVRQEPWARPEDEARESPAAAETLDLRRLLGEIPAEKRRESVAGHVREQVARILGVGPDALDPTQGFFQLGMSSLMTIELRNRLQISLGSEKTLATAAIFERPSVDALSGYLCDEVLGLEKAAVAPSAAGAATDDELELAALADLSPEEVERQLAEELERLTAEVGGEG